MKTKSPGFCRANLLATALAIACWASGISLVNAQTPAVFFTFDAPDAGTGTFQGTFPSCINQNGFIAGYYQDSAAHFHGFFRTVDGPIVEFDPPNMHETVPTGINNQNRIIGNAARIGDSHLRQHGFLRSVNGHFQGIDFPGAIQTFPRGIDDAGNIVGSYTDSADASHGFLQDLAGTFTTLDAPGAGTGLAQGTVAVAINDSGVIAGHYADSNSVYHAFVRDSSGTYTIFDAPDAGTSAGEGTFVVGINSNGTLLGHYTDSAFDDHPYVRDTTGGITPFGFGSAETIASGLNDLNAVVGTVTHGNTSASFRRDASGNVGVVTVEVENTGSAAIVVNNQSKIVGTYTDDNQTFHAYVKRAQTGAR